MNRVAPIIADHLHRLPLAGLPGLLLRLAR